jgi:hypothetical protein
MQNGISKDTYSLYVIASGVVYRYDLVYNQTLQKIAVSATN